MPTADKPKIHAYDHSQVAVGLRSLSCARSQSHQEWSAASHLRGSCRRVQQVRWWRGLGIADVRRGACESTWERTRPTAAAREADGRSGRPRPMARRGPGLRAPAGLLLLALLGLALVGWGVAEATRSALQGADLAAVRDLAAERTVLLTGIAHAVSVAGHLFVIAPLATIACAAMYRRPAKGCGGRRRAQHRGCRVDLQRRES